MMRNIAAMDYDELVGINNGILADEEIKQLEDHKLVTWFEKIGESSLYNGCYWYGVQIKNPLFEDDNFKTINVYSMLQE